MPLTDEGRRKAGRTRALRAKLAKPVRVLSAEQLRALQLDAADDIDALIPVKKKWFAYGAGGEVDPATWREGTRILVSLNSDFRLRDAQRRISQLQRQLAAYEKERRARGLPARSA